ncbi:MAG: SpoIIE family protein phosphatase, partial [Candidatus Eremiobacteraeota bacterium]|nr:SpoIIE family protein phosphatase [Candidatus Eremiobacteraeota bacterium]
HVFRSPELAATVQNVVAAIVPTFAGAAGVTLNDPTEDERAMLPLVTGIDLSLPLVHNGAAIGNLQLRDADRTDLRFLRGIAERCALAIANARRFERERHVALTFQNAALVSKLPSGSAYRFDAIYEAGSAEALVGGDWYDAFRLADGRFVVSIGDVLGSGLEAAIAMVNVRQTLRGVAQVHPDPAMMLEAAERTLRAQHPDRFVTAFLGVIDPVTQQCAYANAGHPGPYLRFADGTVVQIPGGGVPLGLGLATSDFEVRQFILTPGSMLVLYTDGLIEATRDVLEGERRLERALRDPALPRRERSAEYLRDSVLGDASRDDIAIMVVTVETADPVQRWRFDPRWADAAARVRKELCQAFERVSLPPARVRDAELVFSELMSNSLRHAPGTVDLILETHSDRIVLHVLDKGPGFQFSPRLPRDLYSEMGRGLFIVASLANEFIVERRPGGGNHSRITLRTDGRN